MYLCMASEGSNPPRMVTAGCLVVHGEFSGIPSIDRVCVNNSYPAWLTMEN